MNSDSVRKPCAIGAPKGPSFARSGSTWIHWWSSVASANVLMRSWVTWPLAPNRSRLVIYTLFPEAVLEQPGLAEKVAAYVDFMKVIVDEDRTMVESLQNRLTERLKNAERKEAELGKILKQEQDKL